MIENKGFTLIELLICFAILSILLSATVSMGGIYKHQRSALIMDELKGLITYARYDAIRSGNFVTICPSSNNISCTDDWSQPLIAFQDDNHNKIVDKGESVGRSLELLNAGESLTLSASAGRKYIRYNSKGVTHGTFGNILYCDTKKDPKFAKMLIVNRMGRVRKAVDYDGDGIVESSAGKPITCS